jgi:hypothetical protein
MVTGPGGDSKIEDLQRVHHVQGVPAGERDLTSVGPVAARVAKIGLSRSLLRGDDRGETLGRKP